VARPDRAPVWDVVADRRPGVGASSLEPGRAVRPGWLTSTVDLGRGGVALRDGPGGPAGGTR